MLPKRNLFLLQYHLKAIYWRLKDVSTIRFVMLPYVLNRQISILINNGTLCGNNFTNTYVMMGGSYMWNRHNKPYTIIHKIRVNSTNNYKSWCVAIPRNALVIANSALKILTLVLLLNSSSPGHWFKNSNLWKNKVTLQ